MVERMRFELGPSLANVQHLCERKHPYRDFYKQELEEEFVAAMRENLCWHQERSPFFKAYLQRQGWSEVEKMLVTMEDLQRVPMVLAKFFKRHEMLSIPREQVFLHLTSSGTMGEKSQVFFDEWSIKSAQQMVTNIFDYYGWIENSSSKSVNYLLYTYEPTRDNAKLGTAYTDNFLCQYAPMNRGFTALRALIAHGNHRFDWSGTLRFLEECADSGVPVRIFGFPAFFYFTIKRMRELAMRKLKLHPDSLVFLGGGWKGHQGEAIAKRELYALAEEWLGLRDERLRDGFGSVEHCIPYIECKHHQFHLPLWSRVFIRDVRTLEVLPYGEKGFLQLMSPYITSMPAMNVLMSDLASLHDGRGCGCGVETPYFMVHGRAGVSSSRSCAIAASELLKGE
ncbi:MAG: acyl-protein synthase [Oligoflexia bacterium]|nr:acyl-protein synthase [Oligoflexia bacterium]